VEVVGEKKKKQNSIFFGSIDFFVVTFAPKHQDTSLEGSLKMGT
jgi:hypothetical protein